MTRDDIEEIIRSMKFADLHEIVVTTYYDSFKTNHRGELDTNERHTIRVRKWRRDVDTDEMGEGLGGEYMLPEDVTEGALVLKCMKAIIDYQEHEAREGFTYEGIAVLAPHPNIHMLARSIEMSNGRD